MDERLNVYEIAFRSVLQSLRTLGMEDDLFAETMAAKAVAALEHDDLLVDGGTLLRRLERQRVLAQLAHRLSAVCAIKQNADIVSELYSMRMDL